LRALEEPKRLDLISLNKNPTKWEEEDIHTLKISSLNCRSLRKHHEDISYDALLLKSDFIALQETWWENVMKVEKNLKYQNMTFTWTAMGRAERIAIYYKKDIFKLKIDIKKEHMQLSKFTSSNPDIIVLYRSQQGHHEEMNDHLKQMERRDKPQLVIGDLNFCYKTSNSTKLFLEKQNISQLIMQPPHIEGHLQDQAYFRNMVGLLEITTEIQCKYYTDRKLV
jgi:exonuclease III